jgi:hypothetical protein
MWPTAPSQPRLSSFFLLHSAEDHTEMATTIHLWSTDDNAYQVGVRAMCDYYKSSAENEMVARQLETMKTNDQKSAGLEAEQREVDQANELRNVYGGVLQDVPLV